MNLANKLSFLSNKTAEPRENGYRENERTFKWKMGQNVLLQERESKQTSRLLLISLVY